MRADSRLEEPAEITAEGTDGFREIAGRPLRADARRNRDRLLQAAEAVFAVRGIAVPIDDVAREAGVGVGTLYRHFPTKEALFEAIVTNRLERLLEQGRRAEGAEDPGAAFFEFLEQFGEQVSQKRDLADALATAGIDVKAKLAGASEDLRQVLETLLLRAQRAGAVRDDVTAAELFGLVLGTCLAVERSAGVGASHERMLGVVCDGLRPLSEERQVSS